MLWSFLRVEEHTKAYNVISVAVKAATIAAVCSLIPITGRVAQTYFSGLILVEGAFVAGLTAPLVLRGLLKPERFDLTLLKAAVAYGAPLVIYEFSFNILGATDRFLVQHFLGPEPLGFYSVAYGLAQQVNDFLFGPLNLALTPMYMRIWTSEGRQKTVEFLSRAFDLYLMGAAVVLAVAAASARDAVLLLASRKYAGAERPIPILLLGLLIFASHLFLAAGLLVHKRTLPMAGALMTAAALNIGLNWFLLPRLGLMGGALAAVLSYSVCVFILARISMRLLPLHFYSLRLAKYLSAAGAGYMVASIVELGKPAYNLAGKSVITLVVYIVILYALDRRIRDTAAKGMAMLRLRFS
jgi:O-antigen/teichoic acid export membrane protein